jgi:membrane-associated phospholipid phosphatase
MDSLISFGVAFTIAFQSLGGWLEASMKFFSFLGSEDFFLIALPLVYWCIDSTLGLRIGVMLLFSSGTNNLFKLAMHGPRPYWVSAGVQGMASETGFGVPSGHSQTAAGVWGIAAASHKRTWAWVAASLIVLLIGLSRLYLGVHFLHDVLLGWFLGGLTLWAFIKFWDPIAARLKKMTMGGQILLAFAFSLAMVLLAALIIFLSRGFVIPAEWIANATRNGGDAPIHFPWKASSLRWERSLDFWPGWPGSRLEADSRPQVSRGSVPCGSLSGWWESRSFMSGLNISSRMARRSLPWSSVTSAIRWWACGYPPAHHGCFQNSTL